MRVIRWLSLFIGVLGCSLAAATPVSISHARAMHGAPRYPADFSHFAYVNPDAPKGGILRQMALGSFDSFNPFVSKGTAADGLDLTLDTLMVSSLDEPFTAYGLIAETIEVPEDNSWVAFRLRPEARFHDGTPILAEDVVFTFNILREQGAPHYQAYYADVADVQATDRRRVLFRFQHSGNRELPLILGQLPVLPKHYWAERDFSRAQLQIPLTSGPYRIDRFDAGRSITYRRVEDYWARDLPVRRGLFNFDRIRFDYYRDNNVALEAFKAGEYDFRLESSSKNWATGYQSPALRAGRFVMDSVANRNPQGMQGFIYNLRRRKFEDIRVREALGYLFDFEWTNRNLFYSAYTRSHSYFSNSELAAEGMPSTDELALLEPLRALLPPQVFGPAFTAPVSAGNGQLRPQMRQAYRLLREAGYRLDQGVMRAPDGQPLVIEMLLYSPDFERVVLPFARNLKQMGIDLRVRRVDVAQYIQRIRTFDYDMLVYGFGQSSNPGNEQRAYWTTPFAEQPGSRNLIGIRNPAIDQLVDILINADSRSELITATRALDRVLTWNHYLIPHWNLPAWRIAYWNHLAFPQTDEALYQLDLNSWWDTRAVTADKES